MKKYVLVLLVSALVASTASAGDLQKKLKSNWLGAWVVVKAESYSDCSGMYTNNRINGDLVKSKGRLIFKSGEVAKLQKVDAKRSRLDLMLVFQEPVLMAYQDGPFTLYRESTCKAELEIELPRELVKRKDIAGIEEYLAMIVERHTNKDSAEGSDLWNLREMKSYPDDYDLTLARHAVWKAEQLNVAVDAKLNTAVQETSRVTDRITTDPAYLDGFARGVVHSREHRLAGCQAMLGFSFASKNSDDDPGYVDGMELTHGLELIRRLPECYVPVPDPPILHEARAQQ